MKTTIELDDDLLAEAKRRAAQLGTTLRAVMEQALRAWLLPRPEGRGRYRLKLPVVKGRRPPAVDVADRDALYDLMEGRGARH